MTTSREDMSLVARMYELEKHLAEGHFTVDDALELCRRIKGVETGGTEVVEDPKGAMPAKKRTVRGKRGSGKQGWLWKVVAESAGRTEEEIYDRAIEMGEPLSRNRAEGVKDIRNQLMKGSKTYRQNPDGTWRLLKPVKPTLVA